MNTLLKTAFVTSLSILLSFQGAICQFKIQDAAVLDINGEMLSSVLKKSKAYQRSVVDKTKQYLTKLQKHEKRIARILESRSLDGSELLFKADDTYTKLLEFVLLDSISTPASFVYNGYIDSVSSALAFLSVNDKNISLPLTGKVAIIRVQYDHIQSTIDKSNYIANIIKVRESHIQSIVRPIGLVKEFKAYQKDVFYYRALIDEYRVIATTPSKAESKLLQVVQQLPEFRRFFKRYSQLGKLFDLPGDETDPSPLVAGLQTRNMVMQQIALQIGGNSKIQQNVSAQITSAQTLIDKIKEKVESRFGANNAEFQQPDFKPNNQKTKTFWKRIELGTNIQSQKSSFFFPLTTDVGLSAGYKFTSAFTAGVGASYKVGWGSDFRHIKVTHEGIGLRSFAEYRLKGSFWLSGGGEMNYRDRFYGIDQLKEPRKWQQSIMTGLSRKYRVSKKLAGNVQLLFDFLHSKHSPQTQPLVFRAGYTFK